MKTGIFKAMSVALAVLLVLSLVVGCGKREPEKTETSDISTDRLESEKTDILQESADSQDTLEPKETNGSKETNKQKETAGQKESDAPDETVGSQGAYVPEEPPVTEGLPASEYTAKIGSADGNVGDEVTVLVEMLNAPELFAMVLSISYDDNALELTAVASGEAMSEFTYVKPSRFRDGANFLWYANDPASVTGTALELTFKIKDTASAGEYKISMTCDKDNTFDGNDKSVSIKISDGSVEVTG